jgi:hypothetical protein
MPEKIVVTGELSAGCCYITIALFSEAPYQVTGVGSSCVQSVTEWLTGYTPHALLLLILQMVTEQQWQ